MPTYTVQGPSGKKYTIQGPEGATAEDLGRVILDSSSEERAAVQMQRDREEYSPTKDMTTTQRVLAGIGQGMTDLVRGAGQWVGAVDRADIANARRLDAPLMQTTAGKAGAFVGKAVPIAASSVLIPGANTLLGAAGIGAGAGAIEPSESTGETLRNIGIGGAAGAVGQKAGNMLADWLAKRAASKAAAFATQQASNAQRLNVARDASQAGYVIPPSDAQPQNALLEALGGLSGKIKTAQVASARNQSVSDKLARQALGLPPDAPLDVGVLNGIRQQAGQAYDAVASTGTVTTSPAYEAAIDAAVRPFTSQAASFPGRKVPAVVQDIQALKTAAFDAGDAVQTIKVLRNDADAAYRAGDKLAGKAYKDASMALEQAIDDHLVAVGAPANLLNGYRAARELIAKTYTVQKALNPQTGEVSAASLAADLGKGKPLSAELKQVAQVAQAFPKSTQALKEAPKALSPLDWAMAGSGLAGSGGNPLAALGLVARPGVRSMLLSQAVQRNALRDLSAPRSRLASITDAELSRLLYGPLAATGAIVNAPQ